MKLYDAEYGHEVAVVEGGEIISRHGDRFRIEGYAVINSADEVVGTYDDGKFYNRDSKLMAIAKD